MLGRRHRSVDGAELSGAGTFERVLLVATDTTTRHLAVDDARTRILFGDGAAAFLIERDAHRSIALRSWVAGSDGSGATFFHIPVGDAAVSMHGRELFRFAAGRGAEALQAACSQAGLTPGHDRPRRRSPGQPADRGGASAAHWNRGRQVDREHWYRRKYRSSVGSHRACRHASHGRAGRRRQNPHRSIRRRPDMVRGRSGMGCCRGRHASSTGRVILPAARFTGTDP